jgi:hypothetical protein
MDEAADDEVSPGLHELVKKQPGFIIHVVYPTPGGSTVGEVWDSQAQQEAWFNQHVKPNLPSAVLDVMPREYIQVHAVVQP